LIAFYSYPEQAALEFYHFLFHHIQRLGGVMMFHRILLALILCTLPVDAAPLDGGEEGQIIRKSTRDFTAKDQSFEKSVSGSDFLSSLKPFGLNVKAATTADINSDFVMPNLGFGKDGELYDIILQPGHFARTSGKLGTSGAQVSEQKLVAFIVANIAKGLEQKKLKVLVIPADKFSRTGLKARIFLAVHADGSVKPCKTGPSLGYSHGSSLLGMHTVAFALATSLGQTYSDFMKDNFTVDEKEYYAFKYIQTETYGGLLEVGELTCPETESSLIENALLISTNLAAALKASVDISKEKLDP
jgi:N-acetylmuramoyl-L-alanine amidase